MENTQWLIWSTEHNAWWKPAHDGYTIFLEEVGVYSYEKALEIIDGENISLSMGENTPHESMILLTVELKNRIENPYKN